MNKSILYLSIFLIGMSINSEASKILKNNGNDSAIVKIDNFKSYKEYRLKQLKDLKQNGIVDDSFVALEISRLEAYEKKYATSRNQLDGSRLNHLACNPKLIASFENSDTVDPKIKQHFKCTDN